MSEVCLNDFSIQMYENSPINFALLRVEIDENGKPEDLTYVYCNDAFARLNGGTKDQFLNHRFSEKYPDSNHEWLPACYEAAYEERSSEINDYSPDLEKYLHFHVFFAGKKGYCAVIIEDFTRIKEDNQKRIEQANRELRLTLDKEEQFRQATISDSMIVANLNITKNIVEDEIYERINGEMIPLLSSLGFSCPCPLDIFIKTVCDTRVGYQYKEEFLKMFSQKYLLDAYEKGQLEHTMDYVHLYNKEQGYIVRNTLLLAKDPASGDIISFCNIKDISEQKRKEETYLHQLEHQKQELKEALEMVKSANDAMNTIYGIFGAARWSLEYDDQGKIASFWWSDEVRKLLGYSNENDFPNRYDLLHEHIHPNDIGNAEKALHSIIHDSSNETGCDFEARLSNKNGIYKWHRIVGKTVKRPDGTPGHFYGIIANIEAKKHRDQLEAEKTEALKRAQTANQAMNTLHEVLGSANWRMEYNEQGERTAVFWSESFRKMIGFHNELEFPNTFEAWFDRIHPNDQGRTRLAFDSTVEDYSGATNCFMEYRLMTKNRGYRWFATVGRLTRRADGTPITFYGMFMDIDERKKMEISLEESRRKQAEDLCMVTGLSHEYHALIIIFTRTFRIKLYRDTGAGTLQSAIALGKSDPFYEPFIRNYIEKYIVEEDRKRVSEAATIETLQKNISENGIYTINYRRVTDQGIIDHRQMVFSKAISEDGEENWVLGFRDINKLVEAEQRQKKLLEDALAAAQHANRAKTVFLNNMSHDIRTPMNAIIGFTSLATSHIDNKEQVRDYLNKITISSNHLLSLINDVLDMSRIESGKVKIEENEVHLPDILHGLKTIAQADIHSRQLDFFMDAVDIVNENIICDKLRLNQVLLNLLSNAMKFTKPGGTVSVRVIQKQGAPAGYANYEFKIQDSGIGMSEEFLAHMFEPFEREQSSTTSGIQGTGLGLAITKNIVDMMGGTITVSSKLGEGTEFTVSLQFRVSGNAVKYEPIPELVGLRALVADDDYHTCASVTKMLSAIGMRSDWTTSGKESILRTQLAMEQNDSFDAYIIDWLMPDMNGIEIVRRIRRIIGNQVPIIILTAHDWTSIEDEAREAGVTGFCSKPLFMSELREVLTQPSKIQTKIEVEEEVQDFTGKKVLLVEDNELNQEIAMEILTESGFIVDLANDGTVAVDKMSAAVPGQYDLILMDVQMPTMDGYEATRQIRQLPDPQLANIPIIAMTANAFDEDKQNVLAAGMNEFVAKPIDLEKLFKTLSKILK